MEEVWELYLDESGEFRDDQLRKEYNPSLVGGVLCQEGRADSIAKRFDGKKSHATEDPPPLPAWG